jgi:acetoin utilization deacetylase AcuC-like enzyme
MRFGVNQDCLDHEPGVRHPENPDRIRAIEAMLEDGSAVEYTTPPPATREEILTVHDPEYVDTFRTFVEEGGGNWDPDTVATEGTWNAALASAGLARWTVASAIDADIGHETPFSLGRPPGHHARRDDAMGFCFFNNVAIGAHDALTEYGAARVAIVDVDVHHGNGTQEIFWDRKDVFYASIHERGLYPGTGETADIGDGPGVGYTMNIPLPPRSSDLEYLAVLTDLIAPAVRSFDPDVLLVSAGFDAHRHDPISRMHLRTDGYGLIADRLVELATSTDASLGFVLEGGYSLEALAASVSRVHDILEGETVRRPQGYVDPDVATVIDDVRRAHDGVGDVCDLD